MTQQENRDRRLAAIMFTDMVNYSELMQKNEANTLKLLKEQQSIVNNILEEFGGRQIKTIGDGFFSQFDSVLIALDCGIRIQEKLAKFNSTRHVNQRIHLRIGIHLGDVEIMDNDAYGDGVNIASRIEPFADPGGICITEDVYRQVMNKSDLTFRPIGKKNLKNITYSPDVYKVILPWQDRRQKSDPTFPREKERRNQGKSYSDNLNHKTPDDGKKQKTKVITYLAILVMAVVGFVFLMTKKSTSSEKSRSIAVLPFDTITDATGNDHFAQGITEDIISKLSEIRGLRVIARTSVLQYDGTTKSVLDIAGELDVNTILEGSIRREKNRVRVVVQLIDVLTDDHLWTNTYDKELNDIFAVQSDIAQNIASALTAELTDNEISAISESPTINTEAYQYYREGLNHYYSYSFEGYNSAIEQYNKAIQLDPEYALVYAELGNAYGQIFIITQNPKDLEKGLSSINKALSINKNLAEAYKARALLDYAQSNGNASIKNNIRATELKPGYYDAIANVGNTYIELGNLSEALRWQERSYPLNPYSLQADWHRAQVYFMMDESDRGMEYIRIGIQKFNQGFRCRSMLIQHYINSKDFEQAKKGITDLLEVRKNDKSINDLWSIYHYMNGDFQEGLEYADKTPFPTDYSKLYHADMLSRIGKKGQSEQILSEIELRVQKRINAGSDIYRPYYVVAQIYAIKGEKELSMDMLQKAINRGFRGFGDDINFLSWKVNPIFSNFINDSKFIELQQEVDIIINREKMEAGITSF